MTKKLADKATGPLAGVRVLDMTSVIFGTYATQIIADLGADVIKVEAPGAPGQIGGDTQRRTGATPDGAPADLGPIFMTINRNKRSILLDLREEKGKRTLRGLLKTCDVIASSIRYDAMSRLGLSYEDVKAVKPDIVYVHGAGYGSDGPYAGKPAYDDLIQSASGMADLIHRATGAERPVYFPALMADKVAGLFMANAITAALFHKLKTGEGQFVEVPMLECVTSFNMVEHFFGHVYDPPTGPWTYTRVTNANRRPFKTKDGYMGILPYSDKQWNAFFGEVMQDPVLANDARFATLKARVQHMHELYPLMEKVTVTKTTDEWLAILKKLDVPSMRLNTFDQVMDDPHLKAVSMFERYEHPEAGAYFAVRPPVRYSASPANIRLHAPRLGEHTEELTKEAGEG